MAAPELCQLEYSFDSLPLFTFDSIGAELNGSVTDCAICLLKFEPSDDKLRLLPLCRHAFHAACIDTWIVSNNTCPLCRSAVHDDWNGNDGSFRIEIGSTASFNSTIYEMLQRPQPPYVVSRPSILSHIG